MDSARMELATVGGVDVLLRDQLVDRQRRLLDANRSIERNNYFTSLLEEVDDALRRFEDGTYGICEECHDPIEPERLLADPLMRVCLGDLTLKQRQTLEDDLQLAAEIQRGLLPLRNTTHGRWHVDYVYEPAGIVSGDYCDVIAQNGDLYFILGDVSGKGMAASLLMSNLHAMFHSLIPLELPIAEIMRRANQLLAESTMANLYATLVFGKANEHGELEVANAGHLPPILIKNGVKGELDFSGLPLGMFCDSQFASRGVKLNSGDSLLIFTDGVTEAVNDDGDEFGTARLCESINGLAQGAPQELIEHCLAHVAKFRGNAEQTDDLSMLALSFA